MKRDFVQWWDGLSRVNKVFIFLFVVVVAYAIVAGVTG